MLVVVKVLIDRRIFIAAEDVRKIYSAVDFCSANCYPKVYDDVVD